MVDLNITSGVSTIIDIPFNGLQMRANVEPGLKNSIRVVDGYTWEGGRGERCDAIRKFSEKVPY